MDVTSHKRLIFSFVLILFVSCSKTKIIYNYADFLLLNWFESYFELKEPQRLDLEKKMEKFFLWHRKSELPKIVLFLEEFKARYGDGIDKKDINWIASESKLFWKRILDYTEEDIASFLLTVDDIQVLKAKEKLLQKEDDWLIKQSKMTSEELRKNILDRTYEFLDEWLGELEPSQKEQIATWVKPDTYWIATKLKNREKLQNDLIGLLRSKELLKENIHSWISNPKSHWTEEFKATIGSKKQEWETITLEIDSITLPRQRKQLIKKINEFINDFKDLAGVEEKYEEDIKLVPRGRMSSMVSGVQNQNETYCKLFGVVI